jgi:hypothetical protein
MWRGIKISIMCYVSWLQRVCRVPVAEAAPHLGDLQLGHGQSSGNSTTLLVSTAISETLRVSNTNSGPPEAIVTPVAIRAESIGAHAITGNCSGNSKIPYGGYYSGVVGRATGFESRGVSGISASGDGVYGYSGSGRAGYFQGNVSITGFLFKGISFFRIDHPLDPENKYLSHSAVESPDMLNVYNGNVTTDDNGDATVVLPDYFESLNQDFRYQLTVIGQFTQAIVAEEVRNNQFTIKTDRPGGQSLLANNRCPERSLRKYVPHSG